MQSHKKQIISLVTIGLILISCLAIFQTVNNSHFRITTITPDATNNVPTSLSRFSVEFNQTLAPNQDYTKNLGGDVRHITKISVNGKSMTIFTEPHENSKHYSFQIKNIKSTNGEIIESVWFKYTAKYIPYNKLSRKEQQLYVEQNDSYKTIDPIINKLPHDTLSYRLSAIFGSEEDGQSTDFVLTAELYLSNSDTKTDEGGVIIERKKEVTDYILSLGLKPESYTIHYLVVYL